MILADVEIHRFGLQDDLLALAEQTGMPIATTILGKSVVPESHPLFAGVYEGTMSREEVTEFVESSDCLLMLGCWMTDINLGIFTANLDPSRCIDATSEDLRIHRHHYQNVRLDDFVRGLHSRGLKINPTTPPRHPSPVQAVWTPAGETPVTSARLFARLNKMLDEKMVVIADIGDSLFGAIGSGHEPSDGIHQSSVLHLDGILSPRRGGDGDGESGAPAARHRRRWGVSNDWDGVVDDRPLQAQPNRRDPEQ